MVHETRELGYSIAEEGLYLHQTSDLLHHLRVTEERTEAIRQLAQVSGITDESILDELLVHDISAAHAAALPLVPLLLVAWADGAMDAPERLVIMKAMKDHDLIPSQPAYELLVSWLDEPPGHFLFELWDIYVRGIRTVMDESTYEEWKNRIMDRAEFVAAAAGGFWGIGFTISDAEKAMLAKLDDSFPP
jgi:hypothetical protein